VLATDLEKSEASRRDLAIKLVAAVQRADAAHADCEASRATAQKALDDALHSAEMLEWALERAEQLEQQLQQQRTDEVKVRLEDGTYSPAFERALGQALVKGLPPNRASEIVSSLLSFALGRGSCL